MGLERVTESIFIKHTAVRWVLSMTGQRDGNCDARHRPRLMSLWSQTHRFQLSWSGLSTPFQPRFNHLLHVGCLSMSLTKRDLRAGKNLTAVGVCSPQNSNNRDSKSLGDLGGASPHLSLNFMQLYCTTAHPLDQDFR